MNKLFSLLLLLALAVLPSTGAAQKAATSPGITPYIGYRAFDRDKAHLLDSPHVKNILVIFHWRDLEPSAGHFAFDATIGRVFREAKKHNIGVAIKIWVGPSSPDWIYENGVPLVKMNSGPDWKYPYYFSDAYQFYFYRFIDAFCEYAKQLPADEAGQILFLQVCEGTTGDTGPYQGAAKPLDERYAIPKEAWMRFRMEVWERYRKGLWKDGRTLFPLLFTDDANTDRERDWQLANLPEFGVKKGQFAHGYNHNYFLVLMEPWAKLQRDAKRQGIRLIARGEFDNILLNQPWVRKNPGRVFYWSALSALFHDIHYWNPATSIIKNPEPFLKGLEFYNTHVDSLGNPSQAPSAFCVMRRMMDAADTETFPESVYGTAHPKNSDRFKKILSEFASRGAQIGDESTLGSGPIVSRTRKADNDVGWMVYRGNFFKHLEQIEPEATSDAYWNLDASAYGRFARAFKDEPQSKMYFALDKRFFNSAAPQNVRVSVISKDSGSGSWELLYYNGESAVSAGKIKNTGTDQWKEDVFLIEDAVFNGELDKHSDLIIRHVDGDNTFFHLIEIKRAP